jgi:Helicase associated domain.
MPRVSFEARLGQLLEFKSKHGHCNVPKNWAVNQGLSKWVGMQRINYRRGDMSAEHQVRLEAIGFDFSHGISNTGEDLESRFRLLESYRRETGSKGIPSASDPNAEYVSLAKWIERMRRHFNGGTLSLAVRERLAQAGVSLERNLDRVAAQSGLEESAFQRNLGHLSEWLDAKEDCTGMRNLAYRDIKDDKIAARCYRFVEHLVLKSRQGLLSEAHRTQVTMLGFTVNTRSITEVLNPGPSIRSPEGADVSRITATADRARQEAQKVIEEAEAAIQSASEAQHMAATVTRTADAAIEESLKKAGPDGQTYLTTEELAARIRYDPRTVREHLRPLVFIEGVHYFRPFDGRKILYIWETIERDMKSGVLQRRSSGRLSTSEKGRGGPGQGIKLSS